MTLDHSTRSACATHKCSYWGGAQRVYERPPRTTLPRVASCLCNRCARTVPPSSIHLTACLCITAPAVSSALLHAITSRLSDSTSTPSTPASDSNDTDSLFSSVSSSPSVFLTYLHSVDCQNITACMRALVGGFVSRLPGGAEGTHIYIYDWPVVSVGPLFLMYLKLRSRR